MKHLSLLPSLLRMAAIAGVACLAVPVKGLGQQAEMPPPAPGASRGENFSAKPPAALFQSDCTGAGCHKGPQGLAKSLGFGSLAGFLREHYTNSRESAAALANYLSKIPSGPEPKEREARTPKPSPSESRGARTHPSARSSRAAARSDDEPPGSPAASPRRSAEPSEPPPARPSPSARAQRGRQQPAAAAVVPLPQPEPPPAPPKPKTFDIFD